VPWSILPAGDRQDAFWQNLITGKSRIDRITAFDPSPYPLQVSVEAGAKVWGTEPL